jgi:hypothetical protein
MHISKTRVRKLDGNLPESLRNKKFIPAIILDKIKDRDKILKLGFSADMNIGETLLPEITGPITRFNNDGKLIPDKTKPKVTQHNDRYWTRDQWQGRGETVKVSSIVTVSQQVWQKDFIQPPSIQITVSKCENDKIYITTNATSFTDTDSADAIHKVNLLLELNGSCEILDENKIPVIKNIQTLNWELLPPGKRPWAEQKKILEPLLRTIKSNSIRPVVESRLEDIQSLGSDFCAKGSKGFNGYIVFGFTKHNLYVFESALYGNAIYIFHDKWENVSHKTKAEIINSKLHLARFTHAGKKSNYIEQIQELIRKY